MTAVSAGRLSGWKGYDLFVDAVARVEDLAALVPGGPARGGVARRRRRSPYRRRRPGRADVVPGLRRGRIVVVPSRWPEPSGLVTVEAMLAGCAVVASAHGGSVEIVEDGVTGLLVAPGDAGALADALEAARQGCRPSGQVGRPSPHLGAGALRRRCFAARMVRLWTEVSAP